MSDDTIIGWTCQRCGVSQIPAPANPTCDCESRRMDASYERDLVAGEICQRIAQWLGERSAEQREIAAHGLARALDHYIARSSQGWVR